MKQIVALALLLGIFISGYPQTIDSAYPEWEHHGSFFLITTPDGANLAEGIAIRDFPILVRLNPDFFDFEQAASDGDDIRFSSDKGQKLSYQIENWDSDKGQANIWVKVPVIRGNEKQKVNIHWGNKNSKSESSGSDVFNISNGFLSVFHLVDPENDEVGTVESKDKGTIETDGIIGLGRSFKDGTHINCGDEITAFPSGAEERTTSAWIWANNPGWAVDWGMEARCQENSIKMDKPPVLKNEGYLCDVFGKTQMDYQKWYYATISYKDGDLVAYLNGEEDGRSQRVFVTPDVSYFRIGKRHNSPDNKWGRQWWNGLIDEVRISAVSRSAEWIKLEYENQKELQTLVGQIVSEGDYFTVSDRELFLDEGEEKEILGEAKGAQKVFWVHKKDDVERIVSVDRMQYKHTTGRVKGNQSESIFFRAIYPDEIREQEILLTIFENIPDPDFELKAPVKWNGRDTIEVEAVIGNLAQLTDAGLIDFKYEWTVSDVAVNKEVESGKLILRRAQNSGLLRVNLIMDNGGQKISHTIAIKVQEPEDDPWVYRDPYEVEKPHDNQFYAREKDNYATMLYKGRARGRADSLILRVYADGEPYLELKQKPGRKKTYSFEARLEAGLVEYSVELWAEKPREEKLLEKASNIICGDVYLINGQSNAQAYDNGKAVNQYNSNWVRSYGSSSLDPEKSSLDLWGRAVSYDKENAELQIGYWGMELAKNIIMRHKMPVCIINGAVGGSRIDEHQKNILNQEDTNTIYGRLLRRVNTAGLSHGVRGIIWHQGENDQGAGGPEGIYGWRNYQQYFVDLAASWIEDFPNIQNYYMFQIWPNACSMGKDGSGDMLRDVQRRLPSWFSNMSIMSTLGIRPGGGCHYPAEGYAEMADLILPLIEKDHYGISYKKSITPPSLIKAFFTNQRRDEISIVFDQPMDWNNKLISEFYLDGENENIISGSLWGNMIVLKLRERSKTGTISYLDGKNWNEDNILYGRNGIAALTFYKVPIMSMDGNSNPEADVLGRSPVDQPYPYLSSGDFSGENIKESPDPLVAYRWPDPKAEDDLEVFVLKPSKVETDAPESFTGLQSLMGNQPLVKVNGKGSIKIDFGVEMPAWIEFDSKDYHGGVEMSISEYNQPGLNKTKEPVKYGDTYRLELNEELYDGVRFAWIHVNDFSKEWHINDVRAINQVKPTNYNGSFSCSDQLLTKIWYMAAYSVRASMCEDYFGAIIMDRGDRMSWTGDAHPIQAASLVAFANYDFIRKNIENTANQNNGIRSYSLYWVLSLLDYYKYTGDKETLEDYINNAGNKLDDAYLEFGKDPNLKFYGWDERLTAGFELWFKPAPEAQRAYKMLTIRTWLEFAEVMKQIGRADLESKYSWWARRKMAEVRAGSDWIEGYGLHSAMDAINTGQLTQKEIDSIFINILVNRETRLSLSPFNQYFVMQALAGINKHDDALSTVRDIWGGMIKQGATTPYEVFRPSWNDFLQANDPVPNSQSGIVSLCHPWGAGPVKWINEEVLGIKPTTPGFKSWEIKPHPGRRLEWIKGETPTPYGNIGISVDMNAGNIELSAPSGTTGRLGIPRMGRLVTNITVNGELGWDGLYHEIPGIGGSSSDENYIYFDNIEPGEYEIKFEFEGNTSFYVEPHYQYVGEFVWLDRRTKGNWGGSYGKHGYVLCNYWGNGADEQSLPSYVDSISYFRAFPRTESCLPGNIVWEEGTTDARALAPSEDNEEQRTASAIYSTEQTMTFTAHLNRRKNYQIALYFVDWEDEGNSQAIEMFDAKTLNLISPVRKIDDYKGGKYLIYNYDKSVKFRINRIRGKKISLSGIFFDPVK